MAELNDTHWTLVHYKQRMTTKEWREILLNDKDKIVFRGNLIQLQAKNLGHGVVEISKGIEAA